MRFVPTLLRVILALSLVLNGTGLAAAHAGDAEPVPAAPSGVHEAPIEEAPCHEAADSGDTDPGTHAGDAVKVAVIDHHLDNECCDMGTCDNACPQPLSAALLAAAIIGLHARPLSHPQTMPETRAGPRLPHPIRPPIA